MNQDAFRTTDRNGRYISAADPVARFMRYVNKADVWNGCWLWTGAIIGKSGYGLFWHDKRKVVAHRWYYERLHGALKPSQHVCHTCDVRACVNPAHLFVGSRSDNMRDASAKGRLKTPNRWALYPNGRKPLGESE